MKKTKIVCTIGPATESQESLEKLLLAGMNVMRLNFSHGDFAEHQNRVDNLRKAEKKTGLRAAILQDLSGPKIRIGTFSTDSIVLKEGAKFTLTTEQIVGDEKRVYVNYPLLPKEVKKGHIIFLHDGKKKLQVIDIKGNDVVTKVIVGGQIGGKRGVNLPDSDLSVPALTVKDRKDLEFGIKNNVDFFALSFVRSAADIHELRTILRKKKSQAKIIAKIETPQAVRLLDEVIEATDGLMVARGDLAIEIPAEEVPLVQKMIIRKSNAVGKPVITATQMLESMIKSPVPTRAEVSDIANAIIDGTDAIMLSEETTLGQYALQAVETMTRVAIHTEDNFMPQTIDYSKVCEAKTIKDVPEAITASTVSIADAIGAKAIISVTEKGYGPRMISKHKPRQPIFIFTSNKMTFNQSLLSFGCYPVYMKDLKDYATTLTAVREYCLKNNAAKKGDKVVMTSGVPFGKTIETSTIVVETI